MAYDIKGSGARIRQLRIQNGYTQEKLAAALNVDQSYYGRIETGKRTAMAKGDVLLIFLSRFPIYLAFRWTI